MSNETPFWKRGLVSVDTTVAYSKDLYNMSWSLFLHRALCLVLVANACSAIVAATTAWEAGFATSAQSAIFIGLQVGLVMAAGARYVIPGPGLITVCVGTVLSGGAVVGLSLFGAVGPPPMDLWMRIGSLSSAGLGLWIVRPYLDRYLAAEGLYLYEVSDQVQGEGREEVSDSAPATTASIRFEASTRGLQPIRAEVRRVV